MKELRAEDQVELMKAIRRIAGACGVLGPIISILATLVSIFLNPWFNLTNPWLTELGAAGASYPFVFNFGIALGGILLLVFALGLFELVGRLSGRAGVSLLLVSVISFIAIGIFPLGTVPHKPLTAIFFALFGVALLLIGVDFARNPFERKWGVVSLVLAGVLLIGLPIDWYVIGCALTGGIGMLLIFMWFILTGIRLLITSTIK